MGSGRLTRCGSCLCHLLVWPWPADLIVLGIGFIICTWGRSLCLLALLLGLLEVMPVRCLTPGVTHGTCWGPNLRDLFGNRVLSEVTEVKEAFGVGWSPV